MCITRKEAGKLGPEADLLVTEQADVVDLLMGLTDPPSCREGG